MNFYQYTDEGETVVKSINNTDLGYKFQKRLEAADLDKIWKFIHKHKKYSAILIFLLYITSMYVVIFPSYYKLAPVSFELASITSLALLILIYILVTRISTNIFESRINKTFGNFERVKFAGDKGFDQKYYNILKQELIKVGILLGIIIAAIGLIAPINRTYRAILNTEYKKSINIATIGAAVFPIFSDWYSLRGYARFQLGDYENAISDFDKAYQLESDIFKTMNFDNKIYIKYYLEDYEGAIKDFDTEIKKAENDYIKDSFLWDKAQFLYNIKKYKESLELYSELLEKADSDSVYLLKDRLYLERAQVYQVLGENKKAAEDIINSESTEISPEEPLDYIPKPVLLLKELN
ncbi:MAG: tetratricopeptide repeat protein [Muribaculaceae bacterium]|nr:tetratricopeptide repeat protein [Muribaculaceae bacterium]